MSEDFKTPTNNDSPTQLKPYHQPHLITYGDVREVTRATGGVVGKNDGGSGKDKTG